MTLVTFSKKSPPRKDLYANELKIGECFKVATHSGKGAVYMKVRDTIYSCPRQLELVTGELYNLTSSPVEIVSCDITLNDHCPQIYRHRDNVVEDIPF